MSSSNQVLGDVVESVIGAIFVDSGFELPIVFAALDRLFGEVLGLIDSDRFVRDPYSNLVMYLQEIGCTGLKIRFVLLPISFLSSLRADMPCPLYRRTQPISPTSTKAVAIASYHGSVVAQAESSTSLIARQLVSKDLLSRFGPTSSDTMFRSACVCAADKRKAEELMVTAMDI